MKGDIKMIGLEHFENGKLYFTKNEFIKFVKKIAVENEDHNDAKDINSVGTAKYYVKSCCDNFNLFEVKKVYHFTIINRENGCVNLLTKTAEQLEKTIEVELGGHSNLHSSISSIGSYAPHESYCQSGITKDGKFQFSILYCIY